MNTDPEGQRDEALSFLVNHEAGVLATVSDNGIPRARLVYYTCDDSFNVYFLTLANTRKAADLAANSQAAFVVSEMDVPKTIQIEGLVTDITETAVLDPLLTDFVRRLTSHKTYGIPLEHFDSAVMKLYRLTPHWVRWGDFTFGQGSEQVFAEIGHTEEGA